MSLLHAATHPHVAAATAAAAAPYPLPQVPLLWNRSAEAAAAKVSSVASALGIDVPAAAALYMAVPALASINMPGVVRDRVEALSDALGVPCAQVSLWVGSDWVTRCGLGSRV